MKNNTQFKPYQPNQLFLLPPDMRDWLPDDHLVYFVMDVVDHLDVSAIYQLYDNSKGGQPPFDPKMMVSLLFYAYCIGLPSSRKMARPWLNHRKGHVRTGCIPSPHGRSTSGPRHSR